MSPPCVYMNVYAQYNCYYTAKNCSFALYFPWLEELNHLCLWSQQHGRLAGMTTITRNYGDSAIGKSQGHRRGGWGGGEEATC